jgi:hypothetical protein
VIGASQRILDDTVAALRDLGYTAQATNDFFSDIDGRLDVTQIDMVTLGRQIPPDRQAELKEQIGAINPRAIFIESLAGIPGLITNQVRGRSRPIAKTRPRTRVHARRPLDPADPRRPGSRQGDRLVADLNYPTGPQERLARPRSADGRAPAPDHHARSTSRTQPQKPPGMTPDRPLRIARSGEPSTWSHNWQTGWSHAPG